MAAKEVAEANGDVESGQLPKVVNKILGPALYGEFFVSYTRDTLKK